MAPSDMISLSTPILDPLSGHLIKLSHHRLIIESDLELTQEVRQVYYTNDEGVFGIPLKDSINLNPNLTADQKARQMEIYKDRIRTVSTRGYMIDPQTGEIVPPDENGEYPEGSIPEKMIWISVLAADVPGDTVSDKVLALILQSMQKMAERNRI